MYSSHFGLNEDPFKISPNLRFVHRGRNFQAAFRALRAGLLGQRRVMLLESAPGLGKTALLKLLAEELRGRGAESAYEACRSWSAAEVLLRQPAAPVLLLDEAHHLPDSEVAELLAGAAAVKLVFAASPGFALRLDGADVLHRRLRPLPRREAAAYVRERLAAAGNSDGEIFTADALSLVATASGGVPRLINRICSTSLFMASMAQESAIDATRIAETLGTLGIEAPTSPPPLSPTRLAEPKPGPTAAPVPQTPSEPAPPTPVLVAERRLAANPRLAFEALERRPRRRMPGGALGVATAAATGSALALLMLMLAPGAPLIAFPEASPELAEAAPPAEEARTVGESAPTVVATLAPEPPLPPPTAPAPSVEPEEPAAALAPAVAPSSQPAEQNRVIARPEEVAPSTRQAPAAESTPPPAEQADSGAASQPAADIARVENVAPPPRGAVVAESNVPAEPPATTSIQPPEQTDTAPSEEAAPPSQKIADGAPDASGTPQAATPVEAPEQTESAPAEEAAPPAQEAVVAMRQPAAQFPTPSTQDAERTDEARQREGAARDEETAPAQRSMAPAPERIVRSEPAQGERRTAGHATPPPSDATLDPLARTLERAHRQLASGRLVEPPGDNALESYRAALALEPWNDEVRRGLDEIAVRQVRLAEIAETRGDWIGAVEHLETARAIAPDLPEVRALEESRRQAAAAVGPQEPARPAAAEPVSVPTRAPVSAGPPRRLATARRPAARPPVAQSTPAARPAAIRARPTGPLDVSLLDSADRVRAAIAEGADPNTAYAELRRPLTIAAQRRRPDVVAVLLRHGADPNVQTRDSATPLMYAAWNGDLVTATFLLEAGARTDMENLDGKTPLMAAATRGHAALAELLLRNGADADAQNMRGWTALMYAAWSGHRDVVQALLAQGADPSIRNGEGNTAAALAEMGERPALARLMAAPSRSN